MRTNMSFVEFTIRRWFEDFRPDITNSVDGKLVQDTIDELSAELEGKDPTIKKIIIHEHLKMNYPIVIGELVRECMEELEEENEQYAEILQDWKKLALYNSNRGMFMHTMANKKIPEKYFYISESGEESYREEIKEDIKQVVLNEIKYEL